MNIKKQVKTIYISVTQSFLLNYTNLTTDLDENTPVQETILTPRTTVDQLLLGQTILPTYTPPEGTHIQTDSGHSKVRNTPLITGETSKLCFNSIIWKYEMSKM